MTNQEKHAIEKAIRSHEHVHVTGTRTTQAEIDRRLASEDFKLGWDTCHQNLKASLEWIMQSPASDLRQYAGKPPKKERTG